MLCISPTLASALSASAADVAFDAHPAASMALGDR